jgi:DNA-binding response OmpR family regulator
MIRVQNRIDPLPAVVLLDIGLPRLSGLEVLARLNIYWLATNEPPPGAHPHGR